MAVTLFLGLRKLRKIEKKYDEFRNDIFISEKDNYASIKIGAALRVSKQKLGSHFTACFSYESYRKARKKVERQNMIFDVKS